MFLDSSQGGIRRTFFTPIINAPEVAISGRPRGSPKKTGMGWQQFAPRLLLPLSLSIRPPA